MRVSTSSVLVPLALVVTTGRAWACDVFVSGSDARAWESAVAEVESTTSSDDSDCAEIRLMVDGNRAQLTFRTSDGRTTERTLEAPSELVPTVQALRVTVPARDTLDEAPTTEPEPAAKAPKSRSTSLRRDAQPLLQPRVPPGSEMPNVFGLQVGGRGGADSLVSPILRGYGAILLDRWELALIGGYDARYHSVAEPPRAVKGSAAVVGIGVGRYDPVGAFAITGGGRVLIAVLENENEDEDEPGAAEVRTGAYLGLVFPRLTSTRFRADVSAEIVPQNMRGEYEEGGNSFTPWWAVAWTVGIEMGGT